MHHQNRSRVLFYGFLFASILSLALRYSSITHAQESGGTTPGSVPTPVDIADLERMIGEVSIPDDQSRSDRLLIVEELKIQRPAWIAVYIGHPQSSVSVIPKISMLSGLKKVTPEQADSGEEIAIELSGPNSNLCDPNPNITTETEVAYSVIIYDESALLAEPPLPGELYDFCSTHGEDDYPLDIEKTLLKSIKIESNLPKPDPLRVHVARYRYLSPTPTPTPTDTPQPPEIPTAVPTAAATATPIVFPDYVATMIPLLTQVASTQTTGLDAGWVISYVADIQQQQIAAQARQSDELRGLIDQTRNEILSEIALEVTRLVPTITPVPNLDATRVAEAAFRESIIRGVVDALPSPVLAVNERVISIQDQVTNGNYVNILGIATDRPGWIAIYRGETNSQENLIGVAEVAPGYTERVQILLDSPLQSQSNELRAVLYEDRAPLGRFNPDADRLLARTPLSAETVETKFILAVPTIPPTVTPTPTYTNTPNITPTPTATEIQAKPPTPTPTFTPTPTPTPTVSCLTPTDFRVEISSYSGYTCYENLNEGRETWNDDIEIRWSFIPDVDLDPDACRIELVAWPEGGNPLDLGQAPSVTGPINDKPTGIVIRDIDGLHPDTLQGETDYQLGVVLADATGRQRQALVSNVCWFRLDENNYPK